jgi:hypothetical protein
LRRYGTRGINEWDTQREWMTTEQLKFPWLIDLEDRRMWDVQGKDGMIHKSETGQYCPLLVKVKLSLCWEFFLFTTASRTSLGPTQPSIQWVRGALSLGVKRQGRKSDHSPPSSVEVKECVELYLHSPNTSSWCGVQLSTDEYKLCSFSLCPTLNHTH